MTGFPSCADLDNDGLPDYLDADSDGSDGDGTGGGNEIFSDDFED